MKDEIEKVTGGFITERFGPIIDNLTIALGDMDGRAIIWRLMFEIVPKGVSDERIEAANNIDFTNVLNHNCPPAEYKPMIESLNYLSDYLNDVFYALNDKKTVKLLDYTNGCHTEIRRAHFARGYEMTRLFYEGDEAVDLFMGMLLNVSITPLYIFMVEGYVAAIIGDVSTRGHENETD